MKHSVSVIIPTFDRAGYLLKAMSSVDAARRHGFGVENWEIIVVDDAQDGWTRDVVNRFESTSDMAVTYVRNPKGHSLGPAATRNYGLACSESEFIYLLDDDDEFLPNRFERSLELLIEGEFDVILERSLRVYVDNPASASYITGPYGRPGDAFGFLLTGGRRSHISPGATTFRRSIFDAAGGYDERLRHGEDGELLLRLCLVGRVAMIEGPPVAKISIHDANSSRPDRLHTWQNIKMLGCLYRKMRAGQWAKERELVGRILSTKLDLALSRARRDSPSYIARIGSGAKALRYFDWRCVCVRNLKSIAIWLIKPSEA